VVPEYKIVSIQVTHDVIPDTVRPVIDRLRDFDAIGAVKFIQLVGIADEEVNRAGIGTGRRRARTLPKFTPAKSGGSPQVNDCRNPSLLV
jgi:hypothetical protein